MLIFLCIFNASYILFRFNNQFLRTPSFLHLHVLHRVTPPVVDKIFEILCYCIYIFLLVFYFQMFLCLYLQIYFFVFIFTGKTRFAWTVFKNIFLIIFGCCGMGIGTYTAIVAIAYCSSHRGDPSCSVQSCKFYHLKRIIGAVCSCYINSESTCD